MAHQVIKWIKGRPYLYEGTSYREGGKVKKKWRYLRPATDLSQGVGETRG